MLLGTVWWLILGCLENALAADCCAAVGCGFLGILEVDGCCFELLDREVLG